MILATNNNGKLKEIREILKEYKIISLSEMGLDIDPVEDQDTFYGNAYKKAKEIYDITGEPTIADDSGLCIKLYDGWPGVMTHRFAGEIKDEDRNRIILDKMKNVSDRTASVVCNLVYYDGIIVLVGKGVVVGKIALNRRGKNGFGFDEIFELDNGKTLAEMSGEEKNKVSARRLASEDLRQQFILKKIK